MEKSKPTASRYLLVMVIALFFWLLVGSVLAMALLSLSFFQKGLGAYLLVFVPYLTLFLALLVGSRFLLGRSIKELVNPKGFRWFYFTLSFFVYLVPLTLLTFLTSKTIVPSGYKAKETLLFLPFTLLLIPLQTVSEELFFRILPTRMVYGEQTERDKRTIPLIVVSGLFFLLPHLINPEVLQSGTALFSILFYFLWGAIAMALGLYAEGFEGVYAAHTANNLFVALLVNYQNSALPSRALFLDTGETSSLKSLVLLLILFAFLWVFTYRYKRTTPCR